MNAVIDDKSDLNVICFDNIYSHSMFLHSMHLANHKMCAVNRII